MKTVTILDVPFINMSQQEFINLLEQRIQKDAKTFVITANPEIVMKANQDETFMTYINQADYVTADGIGIVKAAKLLGRPLPERVTGYDSMIKLLELANEKKYKVYLLGAEKSTLEKAVNNISTDYPYIDIVGFHDGFFDWDKNNIAGEIETLKPDIIFVALGVPRQEKWIAEHIDQFKQGVFIGVGGSFDVIAGTVKRAPKTWQRLNLEWLYRLLKQPSRFKRMLALPHFAIRILSQKIKGSR